MHNHNPMKTMKKNILAPVALLAVLFASCAKEVDTQEAVAVKPDSVKGTPFSLTASVDPTLKTTYENEKTFSWKSGDKIQMMIVSSTDANVVSTAILETSDNAATATFSGTIPEGYVPGEYAFYPYGTGDSSYSSDLQLQPDGTVRLWCTMTPDLDNPLGSVPLIGKVSGSNVAFKTATGILKVTLTGIPSDAYWVCLDMPDDNTYALNGNFTWSDDCILRAEKVSGYKWGQKYISFTPAANGETRSFYFAVPVGEIPAGMTLSVATSNHGKIAVKTTVKSINVTANKILNLGTLALPETWTSIGTGEFMDTHLWGEMGFGTNTFEDVGGVDVVIYQSDSDPTKYRIENPYGQATSFLTAEGLSQSEHDDYLTFSISNEGNVTFADHQTGYVVNGENVTIKYIDGGTATKLIAGSASEPLIIQLAPQYLGDGGTYTESKQNTNNKIQIVFPNAVSNYQGSAVIVNNKADLSDGIAYTKGTSADRVIIQISDTPIYGFYKNDNIGPGSRSTRYDNNTVASSTLGYGGSGGNYDQTHSGVKYLIWSTWSSGQQYLYQINCKKFYGITPQHRDAIIGQYIRDYMVGSTNYSRADTNGDNTITLAVSNDPAKGNIMITEFAGFSYDVSANTHTTLLSDFSGFTNGDPVYGVYGSENVGGSAGARFSNVNQQVFYKDQSGYSHYITPSDRDYIRFAFNSDGYSDGLSHDLVVWEPNINNCYYSRAYIDLQFTNFVAYKSSSMANLISLTKEMLSTNTSFGEGGSGDSGGMTALVDRKYDTYWHSNYNGTTVLDEYGIYIQVDLGDTKTLQNFSLRFKTRSNISHGLPTKYYIAASNTADFSGEVYKTEVTSISSKSGTMYYSTVSADASYRYIRLCVTEMNHVNGGTNAMSLVGVTEGGQRYTHLAELQLWEN